LRLGASIVPPRISSQLSRFMLAKFNHVCGNRKKRVSPGIQSSILEFLAGDRRKKVSSGGTEERKKESELQNSIIIFGGGPKKERKKVSSGILSSFLAGNRRKKVSSGILSSFLAGDRRKKERK
jgi:hypothetical protein